MISDVDTASEVHFCTGLMDIITQKGLLNKPLIDLVTMIDVANDKHIIDNAKIVMNTIEVVPFSYSDSPPFPLWLNFLQ